MSVHDPLCPDYPHARRVVCQCDLIARVRAEYNEREAVAEALADLRAKVEALNGILTAKFDGGQDVLLWRSEVIALLGGDDE